MINPEKTASLPPAHTTLVFKACGLLDVQELAEALQTLGILDATPGTGQGPWLACSLDSDGTLRLWPSVHCP